ncbi:MAG: T9SS type A sorting domain-containing protein [Bacteroidota bacterium]
MNPQAGRGATVRLTPLEITAYSVCPSATNRVVYRFRLTASGPGSATLSSVIIGYNFATTFTASELINVKLWKGGSVSAGVLSGATLLKTITSIAGPAGAANFTGLSDAISTSGTTYWVTADIAGYNIVSHGHTIGMSPMVNTSYTLSAGTKGIADVSMAGAIQTISKPSIAATATPNPVCMSSTLNLSAAPALGTSPYTYSWSGPASFSATGQNVNRSISAAGHAGVYTVTVTDSRSCTATATTPSVSVTALPNAGVVSSAASVAVGATATLTTSGSAGGTWSSSSTAVAVVGSTGVLTGADAGSATISYSVTNTCGTAVATTNVTVAATGGAYCAWSSVGSPGMGSGQAVSLSMVTGLNDTAFVCYKDEGSGHLVVKKYNGSDWAVLGATAIYPYSYCAAVVGSSGAIRVAYADQYNGYRLRQRMYIGSLWVGLSTILSTGQAYYINAAKDPAGTMYVVCSDGGYSRKASVTTFQAPYGTVGPASGFSAGQADYTCIAAATGGILYVGYRDVPNGNKATVMKYDGTSWSALGTAGFSAGAIGYMNIALDSSETPCVVYADSTVGGKVVVKKYNGGSWVSVGADGFSTGAMVSASLAIDNSNVPHLAYTDHSTAKTYIVKYNGSSWENEGMGSPAIGNGATGVSMLFKSTGAALVAYTDADHAYSPTARELNTTTVTAITGAGSVCTAATATLADATTGGTWSSSAVAQATVGSSTGIVTGVAAGTSIISYTKLGCSAWDTVTVNATPNISGTNKICVGSVTTLSSTTSGGTWSSSIVSVGTISTAGVVTGLSSGTTNITYSLSTGCYATTVITVNAVPSAITGNVKMCSASSAITLSNSAPGGTWSSSNAAVATVGSAAISNNGRVVVGTATGTTAISYVTASVTGCSVAAIVTVNPTPGAIAGIVLLCHASSPITLSNTATGGTWGIASTVITIDSQTGVLTPATTGWATGTVMYINGAGSACLATAGVTVNPTPTAITGNVALCMSGTWGTLSSITGLGASWSSSNASVASITGTGSASGSVTATISGVSAGTAVLTYSTGTGAGCTATTVITVNPAPAPIAGITALCNASSPITLSNTSGSGTWSMSTTSSASINSVTGVVTPGTGWGVPTVTYTNGAGSGCRSLAVVSVNLTPAAITGNTALCVSGSSITLSETYGPGTWSTSNASVANITGTATTMGSGATATISGVGAGNATISYSNGAGAGCRVTTTVTVNPAPTAITGNTALCNASSPITLSNTATGGTWSLGSTSSATINSLTGVVTPGTGWGLPTVTYTNGTGSACRATAIVTVNLTPAALTGNVVICVSGSPVTLTEAYGPGTWSSSNAAVASITGTTSGSGATAAVSGAGAGNATISFSNGIGAGCVVTTVITVNPAPAAITGVNLLCFASSPVTLSNTATGGTWSISSSSATINSTTGVVTPGTSWGQPTVTYTTGAGIACQATKVVSVNVTPTALTGNAKLCASGSTVTLSQTAGPGTWTTSNASVASITGTGIGAGSAGTATITPVGAGNATITYSNGAGAGCVVTTVMTVTPAPAAITGNVVMCFASSPITLSNAAAGGTWSISATSSATINSTTGVITPGTSWGRPTVTYTNGTGSACQATVIVSVNLAPASITGNVKLCASGSPITLSNTSTSGVWSSSNTAIATAGSTGIVAPLAAGTATISYSTGAGSGCLQMTEVTVNSAPAAITGNQALCTGSSITLGNAASGGTWSSSNPTVVSIGTPSGVITPGTSAGTATISYITGSGTSCRATIVASVNTLPAVSSITPSLTSLCDGVTLSLTAGSVSGTGALSTYNWSGPAGYSATTVSGATSITPSLASSGGAYSVSVSYPGLGCTSTVRATSPVTVNQMPAAITGLSVVCNEATTTLSNSVAGGTWASSTSSVATVDASGVVTAWSSGTATISYTLTGGCRDTKTVTVTALAVAGTLSGTLTVCPASTTTLSSTVSGGAWASSNTGVATVNSLGEVTGVAAGVAAISYSVSNTCGTDVSQAMVTVNALPSAGTITGTTSVCTGSTTTLTSTPAGGVWSVASGMAMVNTAGVVTGVSPGATTVSYAVTNTCGTHVTTTGITVLSLPASFGGTATVCAGLSTTLTNTDVGGSWSSSSSNIFIGSSSAIIAGVSAGTAVVTYASAGTGCSATTVVTVNALPSAIAGSGGICEGATATLASAPGSGTWTSGDASVASVGATSGVVSGVSAGNTNITYTLSTGCIVSMLLSVNGLPAAITGPGTVCAGADVTLSSTSTGGSWSSSNTTVAEIDSATGVINGLASGTTLISYILPNSCKATATINVNSLPGTITGAGNVTAGGSVTLTSASTGGTWASSATGIATVGATSGVVTGVAAGVVDITYTLFSGCARSRTMTVNPVPPTISGANSVCVGATITLTNTYSSGSWTSGNVALATVDAVSGVVTGLSAGTVQISYSLGTSVTTTAVTVKALPAVIAGPSSICVGSVCVLTCVSTNGVSWTSSSTSVATIGITSGMLSAVSPGTVTITYLATTTCVRTIDITVNALPPAITGADDVCVGATISLSNSEAGGDWNASNYKVSVDALGVVTGIAYGTSTITYVAPTGCRSMMVVTVNQSPPAIAGPGTVCAGSQVALSNTAPSGSWSSSASGVLTIGSATGVVSATGAGTATISYIVPTGCAAYTVVTVSGTVPAIAGPAGICQGAAGTFTNAATGGTWSSSHPGVAGISAYYTGVVAGVSPGTATIYYTISAGCRAAAIVSVYPTPPAIGGPSAVCVGTAISLTNGMGGGTWSGGTVGIATINTAGSVSGISAGATIVSYVSPAGCFQTKAITVHAAPGAITGITTIAAGETAALSCGAGSGLSWTSSNTAVATVGITSGVVTGVAPGAVTVTYQAATGCRTTTTVTITASRPGAYAVTEVGSVEVVVYPNPGNGTFILNAKLPGAGTVRIAITDMAGRLVYENTARVINGRIEREVALSNVLAEGTYLLRLHAAEVNVVVPIKVTR